MSICPTEHTLAYFIAGKLPATELSALDQHVDTCVSCRKIIALLAKSGSTQSQPCNPEPAATTSLLQLESGALVDHFRIIRLLGEGAFGEVYLARDQRLGRRVALKMLSPASGLKQHSLAQFLSEAQITAQLNHPHLVAIFHIGIYEEKPYLVLEYLEGQNLRQRLPHISPTEALRYTSTIAQALQEIHRCDILHRDLKPENIIIPRDGRLRIVDLGLAQLIGDTTQAQLLVGTPEYMAPEQWRCEPCTKFTDIWAMGILLHELYYQQRPFSDAVIEALMNQPDIADDYVAEHLSYQQISQSPVDDLISRCLTLKPQARPTAEQLAGLLAQLQRHQQSSLTVPFAGLSPFTSDQAALFYGRDVERTAVCELLRTQPTIAIVGPSGAGKSSFVAAGVLPQLNEQQTWTTITMRPGQQPLKRLAAALQLPDKALQTPGQLATALRQRAESTHRTVLLVVDQLEEILNPAVDQTQRTIFLSAIRYAADDADEPVRIIVTLRDDYVGQLASYPETHAILSQIFPLGRPTKSALRDIIVKPVEEVGYVYDDLTFIDDMIADLQQKIVCLPLLQIAAQFMWEKRDETRRIIFSEVYRHIGGVSGAAGQHAEEIIAQFNRQQIELTRRIFLRLISAEGTRQSLTRSELTHQLGSDNKPALEQVINLLIQQRLLTVVASSYEDDLSDPQHVQLEIIHEQLAQTWPRLARWLEDSREERILRNELEVAAQRWHNRGRQLVDLWHGDPLQEAKRVLEHDLNTASSTTNAFISAGLGQARRKQHRKTAARAVVIALLVAIFIAGAYVNYHTTKKNVQINVQRATTLYEGAWAAFRQNQHIEAQAKLRSAFEIIDAISGRALWWLVQREPISHIDLATKNANDFALSPDGTTLALIRATTVVQLIHIDTFSKLAEFRHSDDVFAIASDPLNRYVATGTADGRLHLWHLKNNAHIIFTSLNKPIYSIAFSPEGRLVAVGYAGGTIVIYEAASRKKLKTIILPVGTLSQFAFHPSGDYLIAGSSSPSAFVIDLKDNRAPFTLNAHQGMVYSVAFTPDGHTLYTASVDGAVYRWSAPQFNNPQLFATHTKRLQRIAISASGELLVTGCADGSVHLWPIKKIATIPTQLPMHTPWRSYYVTKNQQPADIYRIALHPKKPLIFLTSDSTTTLFSQINYALPIQSKHVPYAPFVYGIDIDPTGEKVASAYSDGLIRIHRIKDGQLLQIFSGHEQSASEVSFSRDGKTLVSASGDHTVRLWDLVQSKPLQVHREHTAWVMGLAHSHSGKKIASTGYDAKVLIRNASDGAVLQTNQETAPRTTDVIFSADDRFAITAGMDGILRYWDVQTGKLAKTLRGHTGQIYRVVASSDGMKIISGSSDNTVRIWDASAGQLLHTYTFSTRVRGIGVNPTSDVVAVPLADGSIHLIDLDTHTTRRLLDLPLSKPLQVRFTPDGKSIVCGCEDGTVRVFSVDSLNPMPRWRAPLLLKSPPRLLTHLGWLDLTKHAPASMRGSEFYAYLFHHVRLGQHSSVSNTICIYTDQGRLERWNTRTQQRLWHQVSARPHQVLALSDGCVVRFKQHTRYYDGLQGQPRQLSDTARAISQQDNSVFVISDKQIEQFNASGKRIRTIPGQLGLQQLLIVAHNTVLAGYNDGQIAILNHNAHTRNHTFEILSNAAVVAMIVGPPNTVIAGHANGQLGLWDLQSGKLLLSFALHGSIQHLWYDGKMLYAASELGTYQTIDLSTFNQPYDEVLTHIQQRIPIKWDSGHAMMASP